MELRRKTRQYKAKLWSKLEIPIYIIGLLILTAITSTFE